VASAGTQVRAIHPMATHVMREGGIDLSAQVPTPIGDVDVDAVDLVITLSAERLCPELPAHTRHMRWVIDDPATEAGAMLEEQDRLDLFREARDEIKARLDVLLALHDMPEPLSASELHVSFHVDSVSRASRFYSWLLGVEPSMWTSRHVTFVHPQTHVSLMFVKRGGRRTKHRERSYDLGLEVADRDAVIQAYLRAVSSGFDIEKPPYTSWHGVPMHQMWLKDPSGNLVEIYAPLSSEELAELPDDRLALQDIEI